MPGRALRIACGLAICLAALACDQPTDPLPTRQRQLLIHCVLDALSGAQLVKIEWVGGDERQPQSAHHATVTITAPNGFVLIAEDVEPDDSFEDFSPAYYSTSRFGVRLEPGGTYTLRVVMATGEVVTGTTTVPRYESLPPVDVASQPFERDRDTLRLSWPSVPLARRYQVDVYRVFPSPRGRGLSDPYTTFTDTSVSIPGTQRTIENAPIFEVGAQAFIQVSAVDDNYYTYYHPIVDPFAGAPPSRLNGAIGVFGVVAPVLRLATDVR